MSYNHYALKTDENQRIKSKKWVFRAIEANHGLGDLFSYNCARIIKTVIITELIIYPFFLTNPEGVIL